MAIAQFWNVDGLAAELNIDRRVLSRQLSGLVPDDDSGKYPAYLMESVVRHLYLGDIPSPSYLGLQEL